PRGMWGQWRPLTPAMISWLKAFRALVLVLTVILLLRHERKFVLFGLAWFFITILPALPLVDHFIPYYLFLPVIGLSFVIGSIFTWMYDVMRPASRLVGAAVIVTILGGLLYLTDRSIRGDIRDNMLLG